MVDVRAVAPGLEVVKRLTGHSGCSVLLCRAGDAYFVRKYSASIAYNPRLHEQAAKQARLSALVRTPKVIDQGVADGLVFFDMEYVSGHDFRTYAPLQNVASLSAFAHRTLEPLGTLAGTRAGSVSAARFEAKVHSVCTALAASPFVGRHSAVLGRARSVLETADWSGIPRTDCHGDLTLENMLVRDDGEIVLIDLLDGDLESVWLDAAKLLQDLDSGWSLRAFLWKSELSSADRLMLMLSRYLYEEIKVQVLEMFPELDSRLRQLRTLQAMRVLPYVHDEGTFWHVVNGLDRILR